MRPRTAADRRARRALAGGIVLASAFVCFHPRSALGGVAATEADRPTEAPVRRHQSNPEFVLSLPRVEPDAVEVRLELYDPDAREWRTCGKFELDREGDATRGGRAVFRAPSEGRYLLRAAARDELGNVESGPGPGAVEIVAVYDRTPPKVEILSPAAGSSFASGKEIRLEWRTVEANPARTGAATVHLSIDRGRSWRLVASRLDDTGAHVFRVSEGGRCVACVSVRDASGNLGRGVSRVFEVQGRAGAPPIERSARAPAGPEPVDAKRVRLAGVRYGEGAAALASGHIKEAVARLREAVAADPGLAAARLDLSAALSKSGDHSAAEKLLRDARSRFPKNPHFPYNLGLVLARLSRADEAREAFGEALRLGAAAPEVNWAHAVLALGEGDLEKARGHFREVVNTSEEASALRERALGYLGAGE